MPGENYGAAMGGTAGTPSKTNRYVTDQDPRFVPATAAEIASGSSEATVTAAALADYMRERDEATALAAARAAWPGTRYSPRDHTEVRASERDTFAPETNAFAARGVR